MRTWWGMVVVLLVVATLASADSGRGKHKKMYAVPCPGPVTIDGKFDDWDLSGQLVMYIVSETAAQIHGKFALMYDQEALYLGADLRDDSPMMNRHDPKVNATQGWNADSCQFRMILDPAQGFPVTESSFTKKPNDQMAHLTLWYYTDRQEPVLLMHYGMDYQIPRKEWEPFGVIPAKLYQAKYLKKADGPGFTFEYRIPWSTLGAKRPLTAGDLVSGTVQFNFSKPDGLTAGGGWLYDVMSRAGFTFQDSGCWGKIAFTAQNNLPREMVEDAPPPVKPLPLRFTYDLSRDGEVTVQLEEAGGNVVRTLLASAPRTAGKQSEVWDGLDDTGKPIPAGAYRWRGLVHQPLTTQHRLSVHNSGQPPYKTDDNTGGWGGDHGMAQCAYAIDDYLLLGWSYCESGWGIIKTDLTGKKLWGSKHNAMDLASDGTRLFVVGDNGHDGASTVKLFDMADARPLNWGNGKPFLAPPAGGDEKTNVAAGVAYDKPGNRLLVSWPKRDAITVYDPTSGDLQDTWQVPAPERLVIDHTALYDVLVISQGKVLMIKDGKAGVLIDGHLDAPVGLAVDEQENIYVANRGALQNVAVFTWRGKYLRSIGKKGGRPRVGAYDRTGMLEPGGITIDKLGRLWVAETLDEPKRQSVWEAKSGRLVKEFFGGSAYATFVWMDPTHADRVYCHGTEWQIDLTRGTWKPLATAWRPRDPNSPACSHELRVLTAKNGRQYAWGNLHAKGPVLYQREGNVFKPMLMYLRTTNGHSLTPWPAYPFMNDIKKYPNGSYAWQDANDDQIMQDGEMVQVSEERKKYLFAPFSWVDADLNLWSGNGLVYRPLRIEKDGRPIYDFTKPESTGVAGNNGHGPLWVDPQDGALYTNTPGGKPGFGRWTPDGKLQWGFNGTVNWHGAINMPPVTPGKLWGPTMPLGVAGDFTGLTTYFGPYHLFTRDGLYVGMIMRDGRLGGGLGADIIAAENFSGQLVKPDGMQRYFLLAGDQDGRVTEVFGLDTLTRLPGGTYTHSEADVQTVTTAQADYAAQLARAARFEIGRGGKPGLVAAKEITKILDDNRQFTVRATYDAVNLYVAYDVSSPYELINAVPDPQTIFKGGNLLDIQLATDPAADPKRKTPAPGDVRILVTRQLGKPVAVVFRPKVQGFLGAPTVLTSPTGTEAFDAIAVAKEIRLDYKAAKGSFSATVTIPLALLNWTPTAGESMRLDLGYIFAKNEQGSAAAMRSYWMNNSFAANVVDDVPHESRLEPSQWGTAMVE
jgi:hypothetical protein